jgi:hypothetical protein
MRPLYELYAALSGARHSTHGSGKEEQRKWPVVR